MKKPLLGVLVGTLVYFFWGMASWTVLPWHANTLKHLPEEQLITDTLKTVVTEPGYYAFPSGINSEGKMDQALWSEKFRKGPVGAVIFQPAGHEPMGPLNFIVSVLGAIIIAVVTMAMLIVSRDRIKGVVPRALFVMLGGVLVAASVHLSYWNWMSFPWDYTFVNMVDGLVSFLLLGLAQAKFVPEA